MEVPPDSRDGSPAPDRQDVDGVPMSDEAVATATPPSATPPPPPPVESESEDTEYEEVEEQLEPLVEPTGRSCSEQVTYSHHSSPSVTASSSA